MININSNSQGQNDKTVAVIPSFTLAAQNEWSGVEEEADCTNESERQNNRRAVRFNWNGH